jgi:naphthoate synthase
MEPSAQRRLARVAAHLAPSLITPTASASSPAVDSYNHVHGDVSSEPSDWRAVTDESGKPFVDVIYEKAVEEGIVKV